MNGFTCIGTIIFYRYGAKLVYQYFRIVTIPVIVRAFSKSSTLEITFKGFLCLWKNESESGNFVLKKFRQCR